MRPYRRESLNRAVLRLVRRRCSGRARLQLLSYSRSDPASLHVPLPGAALARRSRALLVRRSGAAQVPPRCLSCAAWAPLLHCSGATWAALRRRSLGCVSGAAHALLGRRSGAAHMPLVRRLGAAWALLRCQRTGLRRCLRAVEVSLACSSCPVWAPLGAPLGRHAGGDRASRAPRLSAFRAARGTRSDHVSDRNGQALSLIVPRTPFHAITAPRRATTPRRALGSPQHRALWTGTRHGATLSPSRRFNRVDKLTRMSCEVGADGTGEPRTGLPLLCLFLVATCLADAWLQLRACCSVNRCRAARSAIKALQIFAGGREQPGGTVVIVGAWSATCEARWRQSSVCFGDSGSCALRIGFWVNQACARSSDQHAFWRRPPRIRARTRPAPHFVSDALGCPPFVSVHRRARRSVVMCLRS